MRKLIKPYLSRSLGVASLLFMATLFSVAMLFAFGLFGNAKADVVWDYGPTIGPPSPFGLINKTTGQNLADSVSFDTDTVITGYSYYSTQSSLEGSLFRIRFSNDEGGLPGSVHSVFDTDYTSYAYDTTVEGMDIYKATFSFDPIHLLAGATYWVGAAAHVGLGHARGVLAPADSKFAIFDGGVFLYMAPRPTHGSLMFQLLGTHQVPVPSTEMIKAVEETGFTAESEEEIQYGEEPKLEYD